MANTKIYTVVKDGEELEQLKTLTAAKKLADAEGAEVYADGKCVYHGAVKGVEETVEEEQVEAPVIEIITADPVISEKPKQPQMDEPKTEKYRLKSLMNVRKKPTLDSTIVTTKPEGTIVRVLGIEKDWLHLADDTFIFYQGGKWADKVV